MIEFEYHYRPAGNEIPTCVSTIVDLDNCGVDINSFTCPTELPCHPCDKDDLKDLVTEAGNATERKRYAMELLRYLVFTDSIGEAAELISDEAALDSATYSKLLVKALVSAQEYEDAATELGELSPTDTSFQELYTLFINLGLADTLTLMDIDSIGEDLLGKMAEGDSEEKLIAQATLEIRHGSSFERYIEIIGGKALIRAPEDKVQSADLAEQLQIVQRRRRQPLVAYLRPEP